MSKKLSDLASVMDLLSDMLVFPEITFQSN